MITGRYTPDDYEGTAEQGFNTSNADARLAGYLAVRHGLKPTGDDGYHVTDDDLLRIFGTRNVYTVYEDRGRLAATVLYVNGVKRSELVVQNATQGDGAAIFGIVAQFAVPVIGQGLGVIAPVAVNGAGQVSATYSTYANVAGKVATASGSQDLQKLVSAANIVNKAGLMDIDLDTDTFTAFEYSSGESDTAFSDASNVDYGFGATAPTDSAGMLDEEVLVSGDGFYDPFEYNVTAESTVSDYGATPVSPMFDPATIKDLSTGVGVAAQVAKLGSSNASVTRGANPGGGNGGQKYSRTSPVGGALIAPAASASQGSAPLIQGIGGLLKQVETLIPQRYAGQLGANKAGPKPSGGGADNRVMYFGLVLVGVAVFLHYK